jgi:predicted nucleic acid-binding protein
MGLMVDTNVFIKMEKRQKSVDFSYWEATEKVFISVVCASELLMGVERADSDARRRQRTIFVESVLSRIGILDFTVTIARVHAQIYAELAKKGQLIGAHDLMIAATARCYGLSIPYG